MLIEGRASESNVLETIWHSKEPEMLVIYGRHSVGKTYLIRQFFTAKPGVYLEVIGIKDASMADQLQNFTEAFAKAFQLPYVPEPPKTWKKAFNQLEKALTPIIQNQKVVVFLDELPWLATKRSGLLQALDYFWNRIGSQWPHLTLVLCGSAASWMLEKLINAKGGLHNRMTRLMRLEPLSLQQTKAFLEKRGIRLNHQQLAEIYMVMGGVPYYLKNIQKNQSAVQNINNLCFKREGLLYSEFPRLFHALFEQAELNLSIINHIAKHHYGISRNQLLKKRVHKLIYCLTGMIVVSPCAKLTILQKYFLWINPTEAY